MGELMLKPNEKDLFSFFQRKRLETAKSLNDENLEKTERIVESKRSVGGVFKNIGRTFQRGIHQYGGKNVLIDSSLSSFDAKHPSPISEEIAKEWSKTIFDNDEYGLAKLVFATTVILDDEYEYQYEEEGLKAVSRILYGKETTILTIKEQLLANYKAISPTGLTPAQKGILFGVAATAAVGVFMMPILLGAGVGASAAATTGALAIHGFGDMQLGLGVLALESVMMGAAITGIAYGGMKLYNDAKVKKEFLSLKPEQHAMYLAIQCTHIQRLKTQIGGDEFKEQLDTVLKSLNVLKGDLDYYLFVEKESTKQNKSKIKSFHDFDDRLLKVLGI
jgi:hypothetical protein